MSIDDLTQDEEEYEDLAEMAADELASLYMKADESKRIFYEEFVKTRSEDYQKEFYEAIGSPPNFDLDDDFN